MGFAEVFWAAVQLPSPLNSLKVQLQLRSLGLGTATWLNQYTPYLSHCYLSPRQHICTKAGRMHVSMGASAKDKHVMQDESL
jgi:hypothetical protein